MILGEAIKNVRLRLGMTQEEVCKRAQLTQGFYSNIENNLNAPSLGTLQKITEAFDLPLFWVIMQATERKDVPKRKREAFDSMKPALDKYLEEIINSK